MDENLGLVIQALKDNHLYENTIIVFASDHGYHLGENNHWTKATIRELDTQVPLLIKVPGRERAISKTLVEYVDLYPTLAQLSGIALPADVDGASFYHLLEQPNSTHKAMALSQTARPWPSNKPVKQMGYSIRTEQYRYTRWVNVNSKEILAEEVYRIEQDKLQRDNLINHITSKELAHLRSLLTDKLMF